jgi:hypothetical protein
VLRQATFTVLFLFIASHSITVAQDETPKTDPIKPSTLEEVVKKLDLGKANIQDGKEMVLIGTFPNDRLKSLMEIGQKSAEQAMKALKFEKDEKPFSEKLRVFILPSKGSFLTFLRSIEQRRIEGSETDSIDLRRDPPHVAILIEDAKPGLVDTTFGNLIAAAVLRSKSSPGVVPNWFRDGFTKYVQIKGNPKVAAVDKPNQRKLVLARTRKVSDAWNHSDPKEQVLIAASLIEFLATGPDADKFSKIVGGFRPNEDNEIPDFDGVLKTAGIGWDKLETSWKAWAQKAR